MGPALQQPLGELLHRRLGRFPQRGVTEGVGGDRDDPSGAAAGNTGLLGVTQFASPSASTFIGQDGFGSGQLASIRIDPTGNINGVFTNGQTRILGQVVTGPTLTNVNDFRAILVLPPA